MVCMEIFDLVNLQPSWVHPGPERVHCLMLCQDSGKFSNKKNRNITIFGQCVLNCLPNLETYVANLIRITVCRTVCLCFSFRMHDKFTKVELEAAIIQFCKIIVNRGKAAPEAIC